MDVAKTIYERLEFETDEDVRFDFYFLPGASEEDCKSHYRDEAKARNEAGNRVRLMEFYRGPVSPLVFAAAVIISDEQWQEEGHTVALAMFDGHLLPGYEDHPPEGLVELPKTDHLPIKPKDWGWHPRPEEPTKEEIRKYFMGDVYIDQILAGLIRYSHFFVGYWTRDYEEAVKAGKTKW